MHGAVARFDKFHAGPCDLREFSPEMTVDPTFVHKGVEFGLIQYLTRSCRPSPRWLRCTSAPAASIEGLIRGRFDRRR